MNGTTKMNSFLKMFVASVKAAAPQFFHKCPYQGVYGARDVSVLRQFLAFYPSGDFKLKVSISDGDKEMFKFQMLFIMQ